MQNQTSDELSTGILRESYHNGFQGLVSFIAQKMGKSEAEITPIMTSLVNQGFMRWLATGLALMTERGMTEAEKRGQVEGDLVLLRKRAMQGLIAERTGDTQFSNIFVAEKETNKDLQQVFLALKTALL